MPTQLPYFLLVEPLPKFVLTFDLKLKSFTSKTKLMVQDVNTENNKTEPKRGGAYRGHEHKNNVANTEDKNRRELRQRSRRR